MRTKARCRSSSTPAATLIDCMDRVRLTFFRSAARGLHVPAKLTHVSTKREARKRRASKRPRVGCCEELGGPHLLVWFDSDGKFRAACARLKQWHVDQRT